MSQLSFDKDFNDSGRPALNKALFMNNVCSCLDSCSGYIQTLNALCASGTVLAHSLLQVFRDLPPYRDAAEQFVSTWEELSKATAGASSGVKTETLMALQEVLTSLEEEGTSAVTASIAAVGSCLLSHVELQSEFSLACWKSLSNLVQSLSSDSLFFFPGLNNARSVSARTQELVTSIRKYYGQVNAPQGASEMEKQKCSQFLSNHESLHEWEMAALPGWVSNQSKSTYDVKENDLEEVLNLLSCQPSKDLTPEAPYNMGQNYSPMTLVMATTSDTAIHKSSSVFRKHSMSKGKRTWPRAHEPPQAHTFGLTSWVWGLAENNTICSEAQSSSQSFPWGEGNKRWSNAQGDNNSSSDEGSSNISHLDNEVFSMGLMAFTQSATGPIRQRRHSSNDGIPDGDLDVLHIKPIESTWDNPRVAKTSTWPLKQNSPHIDRFISANPCQTISPAPVGAHLYPMQNQSDGPQKEDKKYTLFGQIT